MTEQGWRRGWDSNPPTGTEFPRNSSHCQHGLPAKFAIGLLFLYGLAATWYVLSRVPGRYSDFALLHGSAVALVNGGPLYVFPEPGADYMVNMNAPHTIALMAPLALLPIGWAFSIMSGLSGVAVLVLFRAAQWMRVNPWPVVAVALASSASLFNFRLGQLGWILAAATVIAWLAAQRGQRSTAAAIIGVLAAVKVFYLIFFPYWLLRRDWHSLLWASLSASTIGLIGLLVVGPDAYLDWLTVMERIPRNIAETNASLPGFVARLTTDAVPYRLLLGSLTAAVVAVTWWRLRCLDSVRQEWAIVLTTMLLLTPSGWIYYWPIVALPVAASCSRFAAGAAAVALVPWFVLEWVPALASLYTIGIACMWLATVVTPAAAKYPRRDPARLSLLPSMGLTL